MKAAIFPGAPTWSPELLRDLGGTGFNDRASSLRVEQGYWMFCVTLTITASA